MSYSKEQQLEMARIYYRLTDLGIKTLNQHQADNAKLVTGDNEQ